MQDNFDETKAFSADERKTQDMPHCEVEASKVQPKDQQTPSKEQETSINSCKLVNTPNLSQMSYAELALHVIRENYASSKTSINQSQIVKRIQTLLSESGDARKSSFGTSSIQSSVSRALKKYVAAEKVFTDGARGYIPRNDETCRERLKQEIIATVQFGPQSIFQISGRVWLIDVKREFLTRAKELFTKYLRDNCYNVLEFNGYLMLLVIGEEDVRQELFNEISEIYKSAQPTEKKQKERKPLRLRP